MMAQEQSKGIIERNPLFNLLKEGVQKAWRHPVSNAVILELGPDIVASWAVGFVSRAVKRSTSESQPIVENPSSDTKSRRTTTR